MRPISSTWRVAGLLFFSGLCALIYQTVWMREFRLIFGASTAATAAVLAIFMAGLGIGSVFLGRRADAREKPLLFYGNLEVLIAIAAALSPLLLWLTARVYFASGGSPQVGPVIATILRLLLALVVLGPATFLMGGTLPAAARAVETEEDSGRHSVALLYGVNTLGAVAGTLLSTFVMLERFGNRKTLVMAVLLNVLVGIVARSLGRGGVQATGLPSDAPAQDAGQRPAPHLPVYIASAVVGFAFLLMELVWYRMLSPILGGTTYMFGLILAVALLGIGAGGALYATFRTARATASAFAITCSLEALALAIPFALGDRLALLANVLRGLGPTGFDGHVTAWTLITFFVVFPAACVAGYQFPLLIALLGRGRENVGRQIGVAYAWNTGGAIAGSLAGGFGLLPLLTAPGTWRLAALLLTVLAIVFVLRENDAVRRIVTIILGGAAVACALSLGPTGVWRHSGIGAARAPQVIPSRNELQQWINNMRRTVVWERDGRESSVAATAVGDLAFIVNGKSDGASRTDADTQVMSGIAGAALHPNPKSALVIGLGTGSTAGWLARMPSMQRVDVIELEPVVIDFARQCAPVNAGAMTNPKVHVKVADGREALLAGSGTWDVIVSEPSNPYRAGIASLFTREYYEAADKRLARGGLLVQWMQAYAVHAGTMRTVYATLTSVFPHVQTWYTSPGDFLLVASREPIVIDADALRARLAAEPYRTTLHEIWRINSVEQFLARMLANENFARAAAKEAKAVNTDDRTVIEFGFARSLNDRAALLSQVAVDAERRHENRPVAMRGAVDWDLVERNRLMRVGGDPLASNKFADVALGRIEAGDVAVQPLLDRLTGYPIEALVVQAALREREGRFDECAALLQQAFRGYHASPWPQWPVMNAAVNMAVRIGSTSPARARLMFEALAQPFPVLLQENSRRLALIRLAVLFNGCGPATIAALRDVEPDPYWQQDVLRIRADCYAKANLGDLAEQAREDLREFREGAPEVVAP